MLRVLRMGMMLGFATMAAQAQGSVALEQKAPPLVESSKPERSYGYYQIEYADPIKPGVWQMLFFDEHHMPRFATLNMCDRVPVKGRYVWVETTEYPDGSKPRIDLARCSFKH